ncbi:hypothetical protein SAMN02745781_01050 [Vibrio gazogenes DSM 21264]|uniref:Uncharacterized protein n=1 Tax=Vibrio gazogenes DSM 21264 = NBRC 103151 TaxID=1123492 RepID=A0A1M4X7I2_VIBGA|nr:hypothetical protein SAMN02745781_01050 [Vibrio gazogenes DSM 21264] [Vibrio gazogenes DSM 21264 = NBRC 103151]
MNLTQTIVWVFFYLNHANRT